MTATNPKPLDATPERIAQAANDNEVGEADSVRRFADSVVQRLAKRGGLYPDKMINLRLLEAAEKYYSDWHLSGMDPLQAQDPSKVHAGGNDFNPGMPVSQASAIKRSDYRKARLALGSIYREVVDLIVLHDQSDLIAIGRHAGNVQHMHSARAIATERLRAGLYLLALHYQLIR